MLGYYGYTVWLTYLSIALSTTGIMLASDKNPLAAIICLILCGICDMFDGKVARTKKNRSEREKKFGIQIDSLSDIVAFAILPSAIGYCLGDLYIFGNVPFMRYVFIVVFALYAIAALSRLGYFNVIEEERQNETDEVRAVYLGLPVTNTAAVFPLIYCFSGMMKDNVFTYLYFAFIIICGVLFITKIKFKKPGTKYLIFCLVAGAIVIAGLILGILA